MKIFSVNFMGRQNKKPEARCPYFTKKNPKKKNSDKKICPIPCKNPLIRKIIKKNFLPNKKENEGKFSLLTKTRKCKIKPSKEENLDESALKEIIFKQQYELAINGLRDKKILIEIISLP